MKNIDLSDSRISALEITPIWSGFLPISQVDEALKAAGLPDSLLPRQPSRAVSMRRAMDTCAPRGAKIDMLPKGLGVAMSLKDVGALDLEALTAANQGITIREAASYHSTLTAKIIVLNQNGSESETLQFTPDDHPMVPLLKEVYKVQREQYKASEDLSVWFSQTIIPYVAGVGKRSRGGVYYVPNHSGYAHTILQVAGALETFSQSCTIDRDVAGVKVPVTRLIHGGKLCLEPRHASDSDAMEIMVDGIIREVDSALDDISSALEPSGDKKALGKRGLQGKRETCVELEKQIKMYEAVASLSLDLLRDRLTEIQSAIGLAELHQELLSAQKDA